MKGVLMLSWEKMAATLVIHRENWAKEKIYYRGQDKKVSPPSYSASGYVWLVILQRRNNKKNVACYL